MSANAIDPIDPLRIDAVRDPYRLERLHAQLRTDRAMRARAAEFSRIHAAQAQAVSATAAAAAAAATSQPTPPAAPASTASSAPPAAAPKMDPPGIALEPLRDQYTAHCLKLAIQAFRDEQARLQARTVAINRAERDAQAALQARAEAANDLGTIQGLLPQLPYRFVAGLPAILPSQTVAAPGPAPITVGPVAQAAALRNATDDALAGDPAQRARNRRPRPSEE
ncbi:MAG: hypothetical protein J0I68_03040 [Achromobacter sp.]|jgi:hypothetical protein|uniref:Uncharacterized protein n=1 Tax=Achromobacter insuavis TaxID=1287735 RepID=A0A6J5AYZ3_9BURK|nr:MULTISPECIES: hypothetical protein [Achromobacter]MBN9637479.1 hypothetical protein [Achromobacter sp.]CAB3684063.1 hypothetical protein LMG26845_04409 [Achromobacter insuavis]CUI91212.1 Uncharacterised protein [Achromobacter sp. 2789STDY5608628]CUJ30265.1 Uncharacterised protein [Achromobacter sp. 2789STDY5608633]CUK24119.1 Uncharacterised protein [Achromobacter sp. 2789STDY5608615]